MTKAIKRIQNLGFQWVTQDPFLFCVHHLDFYPKGNDELGPDASLSGRYLGNDFTERDGWRMYHGTKVPGFPVHPHRGFETVTFVLKGMVDHADSSGSACRYGERDVQWMTAGKGSQHSEMFPLLNKDKENTLELFQIWLNLPANKKFAEPAYKIFWGEEVPVVEFQDQNQKKTAVDVIAGILDGITPPEPTKDSWAFDKDNEVAIWHISMEANASWEIPVASQNLNRSVYLFEGDNVQLNGEEIKPNQVADLYSTEKVIIQNGEKPSRLLLLQGKPINEPVVQYGPFVMNSKTEIEQAFAEYRQTEFGGWPWPRTDQVHDKKRGRFVKLASGEEIIKD